MEGDEVTVALHLLPIASKGTCSWQSSSCRSHSDRLLTECEQLRGPEPVGVCSVQDSGDPAVVPKCACCKFTSTNAYVFHKGLVVPIWKPVGFGLGAGWGKRVQPDTQTPAFISGTSKDKNFLFFLPLLLQKTLCSNKSGVGNAKRSYWSE